ncbi:hypothetical protein [Microbacterium stercoris]|uniref:Uncharacterized protein n=1 Tax=Microbacterium stercoris TaxID=2820289 RepID=A0A939TV68_9MICO|nr:hypothetical protein [Microbacterium stercoris]MBO3664784.1 hypothetical protein [Microbacterium stercoris]
MGERFTVEDVAAMVGEGALADSAESWGFALVAADAVLATTPDDYVLAPLLRAYREAHAELVSSLVAMGGGWEGLEAAERLGVDVQGALSYAVEQAAERIVAGAVEGRP